MIPFQVSALYRSIPTEEETEGTTYCCCHWKRVPQSAKWVIIGAAISILAGLITVLYVCTHHGTSGFSSHGSGILAIVIGPGLVFVAVVVVIMAVMCHRHRVKRQLRQDQVQIELLENRSGIYVMQPSNTITS